MDEERSSPFAGKDAHRRVEAFSKRGRAFWISLRCGHCGGDKLLFRSSDSIDEKSRKLIPSYGREEADLDA